MHQKYYAVLAYMGTRILQICLARTKQICSYAASHLITYVQHGLLLRFVSSKSHISLILPMYQLS